MIKTVLRTCTVYSQLLHICVKHGYCALSQCEYRVRGKEQNDPSCNAYPRYWRRFLLANQSNNIHAALNEHWMNIQTIVADM